MRPESKSKVISYRYTNLSGVDLKDKKINAWSLAGSNLYGSILPKDLEFDLVERANASSKVLRNIIFTLLITVFACWLVRISNTDSEMLLSSNRYNLPFVSTEVNLMFFYLLTPLIILMFYVYFQLEFQLFVDSISNLPIYFPDGLRIDKKLYPFTLVRITELIFPILKDNASCYSKIRAWISFLIFWGVVPASLIAYWIHYLKLHNFWMSSWHILLIGMAIAIDIFFLNRFYTIIIRSRTYDITPGNDNIIIPLRQRVEEDFESNTKKFKRKKKIRTNRGWGIVFISLLIGTIINYNVILNETHIFPCITTLNLQNANLQNKDLSNKDLDGANMLKANLSGSNLTGTTFRGAKYRNSINTDSAYIIIDDTTLCTDIFYCSKAGQYLRIEDCDEHQKAR